MTLSPAATLERATADAADAPGARKRISHVQRIPGALHLPSYAGSRTQVLKHSVVICGHKTSVSMERRFWLHLKRIAGNRGYLISELIALIEADRRLNKLKNLSGCLRLVVLEDLESRAFAPGTFAAGRPLTTRAAKRAAAAHPPAPRRRILAEAGG